MKKSDAITIFALALGLFVAQTDLGWADGAHPEKTKPAVSKEKSKGADQNAASNCPPGLNGQMPSSTEQGIGLDEKTTGRRDQAVGNDSPLTKNSNKEIEDTGHAPCPPASADKGSAEKNKSSAGKSEKGAADKGGAQGQPAEPAK